MFKAMILNQKRTVFEGEVNSVFLPGTEGEFEVLENHKAFISLLEDGNIIINGDGLLKIHRGVVIVNKNELVALVEE